MSEECKEIMTFLCRYGTHKFEVMPFWLMNASSTFQNLMGVILQGLLFAMFHVDNVVIFSKNMEKFA